MVEGLNNPETYLDDKEGDLEQRGHTENSSLADLDPSPCHPHTLFSIWIGQAVPLMVLNLHSKDIVKNR